MFRVDITLILNSNIGCTLISRAESLLKISVLPQFVGVFGNVFCKVIRIQGWPRDDDGSLMSHSSR